MCLNRLQKVQTPMFSWIRYARDRFLSNLMSQLCFWYRCRIRQVRTQEDLENHDRIVQAIFFKSGIFESEDTELAPELPDSVSAQFVAWLKGRQAGAVTVIQHPDRLPVQEYFNIKLPDYVDPNRLAEITRLVVADECRIQPPVVSMGLLNAAVRYSRKRKIRWLVCCFPSFFIWGFQVFFKHCVTLEQLPLEPYQAEKRKGRESYFAQSRSIRVILIDLESIDMTRATREMTKRFLKSWRRNRGARNRKA